MAICTKSNKGSKICNLNEKVLTKKNVIRILFPSKRCVEKVPVCMKYVIVGPKRIEY